MVSAQTTQLWTLAEDANEYERMHNLFSGRLKSVLNDEKISSALRENMTNSLSGENLVFALHDPCDIRKPYSKKLEKIGRVRDLDGNMINGYSTLGTVCLSADGQNLHLSDISVFSNGDKEHYVLQKELDAVIKKQTEAKKKQEVVTLTKREKEIVELLKNEAYVNLRHVVHSQLKRVSEELKKENENLRVCHVLDRQMDGVPYFSFIDEDLEDFFVIRLKISRNSNEIIVNGEGKEIAGHEEVASALNADCYFAHPYTSWERGTNENTNGLIRQYLPKSRNLKKVSMEEEVMIMDKLNSRPRKCLDFKTPYEVFFGHQPVALTT